MESYKATEARPGLKDNSNEDVIRVQLKVPFLGRLRRLFPFLMILVGLLALAYGVMRFVATEEKFNSPFDQLDYDEENQQGFLPMLSQLESKIALDGSEPSSLDETTLDLDAEEEVSFQQVRVAPPVDGSVDDLTASTPDIAANPGLVPENLLIPTIDLYVPVVAAENRVIEFEGKYYSQWEAPKGRVPGWQTNSAGLGVPGNTVLFGHHNIYGKVFENLYQVKVGQVLQLKSGDELFTYRVVVSEIVEEKYQDLEVRLENARWTMPSTDERITLITCWPAYGNSHRVIVVAVREEPESFIPVSGEGDQPAAEESTDPAEELVRLAPPVDDTEGEELAAPPDLASNPGLRPDRILVPIIDLYAPVQTAAVYTGQEDSEEQVPSQWWAPTVVAAGWQPDSAGLGVPGNTIIYGHLDVYGAVFARLPELLPGQIIQLKAGEELFSYRVDFWKIFPEHCPEWEPESEAMAWVQPSLDERVTLVTCYPAGGYTHRLILVATPDQQVP